MSHTEAPTHADPALPQAVYYRLTPDERAEWEQASMLGFGRPQGCIAMGQCSYKLGNQYEQQQIFKELLWKLARVMVRFVKVHAMKHNPAKTSGLCHVYFDSEFPLDAHGCPVPGAKDAAEERLLALHMTVVCCDDRATCLVAATPEAREAWSATDSVRYDRYHYGRPGARGDGQPLTAMTFRPAKNSNPRAAAPFVRRAPAYPVAFSAYDAAVNGYHPSHFRRSAPPSGPATTATSPCLCADCAHAHPSASGTGDTTPRPPAFELPAAATSPPAVAPTVPLPSYRRTSTPDSGAAEAAYSAGAGASAAMRREL